MEKYEVIKKEILKYPNELEYYPKVTNELITKVEDALNVKITGTYKQFLLDFGFLSFGGLEVFGIPHENILKQNEDCTNVVINTLESREEINLQENLLVIHNFGNGELYCLDLSSNQPQVVAIWDEQSENDEYPPVTEIIAETFEDFLEEYIAMEIEEFDSL